MFTYSTKSNSIRQLTEFRNNQNNAHSASDNNPADDGLFSGALKRALLLFLLFVYFNANAGSPSANIKGPLKAHISNGNISITSEISAETNPAVSYTLINNSTGAAIATQGPLIYDNTTGVYKQTVVVVPGATEGRFNIKLTVTTPGGATEATAGVTVVN